MHLRSIALSFLAATCLGLSSLTESADLKHPDWHPDGDRLIAEGSCDGNIDLYLIDLNTHRVRLLLGNDATDGYPRWLPDGMGFVFHRIDENKNSKIYKAALSSSGQLLTETPITDGVFDIEPSPSPDGTRLVYSQLGENGQDIVVRGLSTADEMRVWSTKTGESFPSWHPDGDSIIFHLNAGADTQIFRRHLDSDQLVAVTTARGPNLVGHMNSQGGLLAYSSERDGDREIYLYNFSAASDTRLTNRPGRDGYPKVSPDGRWLAYHSELPAGYAVVRIIDMHGELLDEFSCKDWDPA